MPPGPIRELLTQQVAVLKRSAMHGLTTSFMLPPPLIMMQALMPAWVGMVQKLACSNDHITKRQYYLTLAYRASIREEPVHR